ncbi:uncharacterized protein LOC122372433 isoform X2 [Amphibalanus amphitrite]|nr:uncharacterized protein LOC122372433 isoform X2 [Amphibalanus amphitrite]XP_043205522.1 uncharacterized protein LOC122372433 isoform X2 [Amphibalanus amphitrite]
MFLRGLMLFWMFWVRQAAVYEVLCAAVVCCRSDLPKYSLADMSYVPAYRRFGFQASEKREPKEADPRFIRGENVRKVSRKLWPVRKNMSLQERLSKLGPKKGGEIPPNNGSGAPLLLPRSGSANETQNTTDVPDVNSTTTEYVSSYKALGHYGPNQLPDTGCGYYEMSYDGGCYYVSKEVAPGYRAGIVCAKEAPGGEWAKIDHFQLQRESFYFAHWLNINSGKTPDQYYYNVYIDIDNRELNWYHPESEKAFWLKQFLCRDGSCRCTVLNWLYGHWHSRMCNTRHHIYCVRPQKMPHDHHEKVRVSTESSLVAVFQQASAGTPAATLGATFVTLLSIQLVLVFAFRS